MIILASEPALRSFNAVELFFEPYVFVCPASEALEHGTHVAWARIKSSKLVLLTQEHCMHKQTMALCDLAEDPGQPMASSLEMLRQMVALGQGAALLPALSVHGLGPLQGLITAHPVTEHRFGRTIALRYRNTDPRAEHLVRFGLLFRKHMDAPEMRACLRGFSGQ